MLVLGVGTFLAILGPFGSSSLGWPWVWVYWTGLIGFGGAFGFATGHLMSRFAPRLPDWLGHAVSVVVVSIPVTFAVVGLNTQFYQDSINLQTLLINYSLVLVITAFVTTVAYAVERLSQTPAAEASPAASAALVDKLPPGLRHAAITSMTAEDHYLRVRTKAGEALILMRLSDAVTACEGLDGARTHRSWWVAREAVTDAQKGDGRGVLILSDGAEAPVSRTYYAALRDAGWF